MVTDTRYWGSKGTDSGQGVKEVEDSEKTLD